MEVESGVCAADERRTEGRRENRTDQILQDHVAFGPAWIDIDELSADVRACALEAATELALRTDECPPLIFLILRFPFDFFCDADVDPLLSGFTPSSSKLSSGRSPLLARRRSRGGSALGRSTPEVTEGARLT